jgi:hypothetical protein
LRRKYIIILISIFILGTIIYLITPSYKIPKEFSNLLSLNNRNDVLNFKNTIKTFKFQKLYELKGFDSFTSIKPEGYSIDIYYNNQNNITYFYYSYQGKHIGLFNFNKKVVSIKWPEN